MERRVQVFAVFLVVDEGRPADTRASDDDLGGLVQARLCGGAILEREAADGASRQCEEAGIHGERVAVLFRMMGAAHPHAAR
jgi:hypothetical protein